jgi:hypothetical protein
MLGINQTIASSICCPDQTDPLDATTKSATLRKERKISSPTAQQHLPRPCPTKANPRAAVLHHLTKRIWHILKAKMAINAQTTALRISKALATFKPRII